MKRSGLLSTSLAAGLLLASTVSHAAPAGPSSSGFGSAFGVDMVHFSGSVVPEWRSFVSRRRTVSNAWRSFVDRLKADPGSNVLDRVNSAVNKVPYVTDTANGRPVNYWASPSEFLARGGDCKDYALAKYTALRSFGVPASSMRILVLMQHAVLVVNSNDQYMVLDNMREKPYPLNSSLLSHAVYAVSDAGAWINVSRQ